MIHLDPHPFARSGSVTICAVSGLHIFQAIMVFLWPDKSSGATCLLAVLGVFHSFESIDGMRFVAVVMSLTAILALVGTLFRLGWIRLSLFGFQHCILGIMAGGGVWAAVLGHYLDGTKIPWQHIATDQAILMAMFIAHTSAILRRSRDSNG